MVLVQGWKLSFGVSVGLLAATIMSASGASGAAPTIRVIPVSVLGDAVAYGGGTVWVGGLTGQGGAVILPVAAADGRLSSGIAVPALPGGIAVAHGVIWATSGDTAGHGAALWRIDGHTGRAQSFALPGATAGRVLVRGQTVWVSNGDYVGRVFKLDALTGRLLATIPVGGLAGGLASSADAIWVSLANRSQLVRIDPARNRVVARIPVGPGAFNLTVAAGRVWVANDNAGTVSEIDAHSNRVLRSAIHIGTRAAGIAAARDQVFVSDPDHSQVIRFHASTPDQQFRVHAAGLNLVVGDTRMWVLGDRRLTALPIKP